MTLNNYRFEWIPALKHFRGPLATEDVDPPDLGKSIQLVNEEVARHSGILWKPPLVFIVALALTVVAGFAASYFFLTRNYNGWGAGLLISTPVAGFGLVIIYSLRPKRADRIIKFMENNSLKYGSSVAKWNYRFSYLLLDGNFDSRRFRRSGSKASENRAANLEREAMQHQASHTSAGI